MKYYVYFYEICMNSLFIAFFPFVPVAWLGYGRIPMGLDVDWG
jgi:hypothetical protein